MSMSIHAGPILTGLAALVLSVTALSSASALSLGGHHGIAQHSVLATGRTHPVAVMANNEIDWP